jgi:hypothetical protein
MTANNMELFGHLGRPILSSGNTFYGPMLHIGPDRTADLPYAAALLGGSGHSIQTGSAVAGSIMPDIGRPG